MIVKPHVENIYGLDDTLAAAVFQATTRLPGRQGRHRLRRRDALFQANEVAGGQTVFHFHIHVLPRFSDDELLFFWPATAPDPRGPRRDGAPACATPI